MADESVRSLLVELGYDVDTTGADRFKSSFKRLETSLAGISRRMEKKLNFSFISKNIKKELNKAKIAVAAGIAGLVAISTKIFKGFANIESARLALKFNVGAKETDEFLAKLEKIRLKTGEVVTELELVQAVTLGGNITDDTRFFVENAEKLIKLGKASTKGAGKTIDAIARFIATGGNLDELVELKIIGALQKQAIVAQSAPIGALGIQERTKQARVFIGESSARVDPIFAEFLKTNQATLDRLSARTESAVSALGEKFSGDINKAIVVMSDSVDAFTKEIKTGGGVLKALEEGSATDVGKAFFRLLRTGSISESGTAPEIQNGAIRNRTERPGNAPVIDQKINQTVSISVNGTGLDNEAIGNVVVNKLKEQNRNLQQVEARKRVSRATNTTIQTVEKQ